MAIIQLQATAQQRSRERLYQAWCTITVQSPAVPLLRQHVLTHRLGNHAATSRQSGRSGTLLPDLILFQETDRRQTCIMLPVQRCHRVPPVRQVLALGQPQSEQAISDSHILEGTIRYLLHPLRLPMIKFMIKFNQGTRRLFVASTADAQSCPYDVGRHRSWYL